MPISARMSFKKRFCTNQGMSLIEILVGLALISLIYFVIPRSNDDLARKRLESTIDSFDRAIRFANNESILRNTIVRLKILMDKIPVEYVVEYGPTDTFILPENKDLSKLTLKQQEKYSEVLDDVNKQFTKSSEFKDINKAVDDDVKILGVATSLYPGLQTEGSASIYFYPSGERDSAIIICSSDNQIGMLEVQPFTEETKDNYLAIDLVAGDDIMDKLSEEAQNSYKEWLGQQ